MMNFLPNKILAYQLYILQLEEYDRERFLKALFSKGLFPNDKLRKKAVWTGKAKLITAITIFLQLIFSSSLAYLVNSATINTIAMFFVLFVIVFYALTVLSFIFLTQSLDIIFPVEWYLKRKMIKQAKEKLSKLPDLKIIGITGSYGKTTMKEVVSSILSQNFKVVKTMGNNNTPIGIARTILNKIHSDTEIFIVEMGEYVKGDVKALCEIAQPDISIITGINEAHLERYKTMENAISTKFEIAEYAKKDAVVLLNADDKLSVENYKKYLGNKYHQFFSSSNNKLSEYKVKDEEFYKDGSGQSFDILTDSFNLGKVKVKVLGNYIIGNIIAAIIVARMLGMKEGEIRLGIGRITPIEHRLQPRMNPNNILVIDDTYNGNSDGIREGINLLSKFEGRRKVYMTPGLVETGELTEQIHYNIGKQLGKVADLVILIKNSVTQYIYKGLINEGFKDENIIWYDYSKKALEELYSHLQPNDVVLMQNDWSDNYS